jgi:hypothetical protein
VCQPEPGALDGLLDKCLVVRGDDAPEPRFAMLESIRDFAAERLGVAGEAPGLRAGHAGYFRALAERMDAALRAGEPEEGPVAVLAADIGNLTSPGSGCCRPRPAPPACRATTWRPRRPRTRRRHWP